MSQPIRFAFLFVLLAGASRAVAAKVSTAPADIMPGIAAGQAWKLVWQDEFDGKVLDAAKWEVPEYKRRDALWSRKAVVLDGRGSLALKVLKEGDEYLDGCARTRGRFEKAFGYFVARMRLQKHAGHWPAFWLYADSVGSVGHDGMDGTEVDIMEKPWLDDRVPHTLHWDGYGEAHRSEGFTTSVTGVMDGWHTFAVLWTPDEYAFFVDGRETWRTKAGGVCQVPLYVKLSDEIEFSLPGWAGDIRKAQTPDETLVDYVRVYDLVEAATGLPVWKPKPLK